MPPPDPKKPLYPNPFYVLLVGASTAFVATVLAYLVAPMVRQKAQAVPVGATPPGAGSLALAAWFDRWGVTLLAVELGVIVVSSFVAMAVDRRFSSRPRRG